MNVLLLSQDGDKGEGLQNALGIFSPILKFFLVVEKGTPLLEHLSICCALIRCLFQCQFSVDSAECGAGRASVSGDRQVLCSEGSPGLGPLTLCPPSSEGQVRLMEEQVFENYLRICEEEANDGGPGHKRGERERLRGKGPRGFSQGTGSQGKLGWGVRKIEKRHGYSH